MREDHLIDAPSEYAHRLRAGAVNIATGGWLLALFVVLSMIALPLGNTAPLMRTGMVTALVGAWMLGLGLWCKGWWRLTDARVESLTPHRVAWSAGCVRVGLLTLIGAITVWTLGAIVRGTNTPADPTLAHLMLHSDPFLAPMVSACALLALFVCGQVVVRSLTHRTAPARPGTILLPLTLSTMPVGVVTLPGAMNTPSALAFGAMGLALLFAFTGVQGAVLRHRITRILRERRRAEVAATARAADR